MNILDFFCGEKPCLDSLLSLKKEYLSELTLSFAECSECDAIFIQRKYLKSVFNILKNSNNKDK
jgi:hypothetical protein